MSDDKLEFLDEKPVEERAEEVSARAEPEAPKTDKGEEPVVLKEPDPAPPAESEEKQQSIPITALLDEREKRQAAERRAQEAEKWRKDMEERQRSAQAEVPDFYNDPDARLNHERQAFQQALIGSKLQQSRFLAERDFGKETVEAAYAYFDQNPQLSHQLLSHPSPFHAAVEFHKRQQAADEIGADPEAWKTKQIEQMREQIKQELLSEMQSPAQPKPRPPGSLASAPASGRSGEPVARGSAFDAAFDG